MATRSDLPQTFRPRPRFGQRLTVRSSERKRDGWEVPQILPLALAKATAELRVSCSVVPGICMVGHRTYLIDICFYLVFKLGLREGEDDFAVFLLCGLVPWEWFASTMQTGSRSVESNKGLILQVALPKVKFPGTVLLANTAKLLIVFVLLMAFLWAYSYAPSLLWIGAMPLMGVLFIFVGGITLLAACIVPFAPDLPLVIDNRITSPLFVWDVFFDV